MNSTESKIYDLIESLGIATEDEISLVTNINGYSAETMMDIIFARTALRSLEQVADEFDVNLEEWGFTEKEIDRY
jgi:hypothetical protein